MIDEKTSYFFFRLPFFHFPYFLGHREFSFFSLRNGVSRALPSRDPSRAQGPPQRRFIGLPQPENDSGQRRGCREDRRARRAARLFKQAPQFRASPSGGDNFPAAAPRRLSMVRRGPPSLGQPRHPTQHRRQARSRRGKEAGEFFFLDVTLFSQFSLGQPDKREWRMVSPFSQPSSRPASDYSKAFPVEALTTMLLSMGTGGDSFPEARGTS